MIQLLIALGLLGVGGFLVWRGLTQDASLDRTLVKGVVGIFLGAPGFGWFATILITLFQVHIGIDSDLVKYDQIKVAMRSARGGDPSYSAILLEAVQWNQTIAISRKRINSEWWGLYYSRQIAELEFIEMSGERK